MSTSEFPRRAALARYARLSLVLSLAILPFTLLAHQGPSAAPAAKAATTWADDTIKAEGYVSPPKELVDAVLAHRWENVTLSNASPDKKWFINMIGDGPVVMKTFSKPYDELGGVFIDFKANRARSLTVRNDVGIQLISASDGSKKAIQLPAGSRVSNAAFSPDGKSVVFYMHADDATTLWIADVSTGASRQLCKTPVLATINTAFDFSGDGKQIAAVLVPDARPARPETPAMPSGPQMKMTDGQKERNRTYPSLMSTPHDFALLKWHATGQIALIDVATGAVKKVGAPAMVRTIDLSPDGEYLRVTQMTEPFACTVPVSSFGQKEELWDLTGKALAKVTDRPINLGANPDDTTPPDPNAAPAGGGGRGGANQNGKRELAWRTDGPGLVYLEQEPAPAGAGRGPGGTRGGAPGGAPGAAGGGRAAGAAGAGAGGANAAQQGPPRKDRLMQWLPPFDAASTKLVYENASRMTGFRFSPDSSVLFFTETAGQNNALTAVYLADPVQKYVVSRSSTAPNAEPAGSLIGVRGGGGGGRAGGGGRGGGAGGGGPVLLSSDKSAVFLEGTINDRNPEENGPKTFIHRVTIKTGEVKSIYDSENNGVFERMTTPIDLDGGKFIVQRESATEVPQNFLLNGEGRKKLTSNVDLFPDLTAAPKQRIYVTRPDGFKYKVKVTLPPGYQAGMRLPALFWFYPAEFESQDAYDRPDRTFNRNTFTNYGTRAVQFFVRLGYAVVEPDTPIVGPAGKQNDNYVSDLRNDLAATIDELDKRGIIDRTRLAIGGHSYGAFSTVNAMVNTPYFKAGIAGDGNYNRTLTPNGFQNERRDLWEAPNVYLAMSPFLQANHLTGALLMYHSLADQNVGTDPENTPRLFLALQALGKTAAMYMYPYEDHGPVARETLLDQWARWAAWLDKYCKNPVAPDNKPKPAAGGGRGGGQ
jgi:dipeptidyl aminopeptidase/acylaminoacyl peptidase